MVLCVEKETEGTDSGIANSDVFIYTFVPI